MRPDVIIEATPTTGILITITNGPIIPVPITIDPTTIDPTIIALITDPLFTILLIPTTTVLR